MKTFGIRIFDSENHFLSVKLADILHEIPAGLSFHWCILFLDGTPNHGEGKFITEYKNKIHQSKDGLKLSWNEIFLISSKFQQIFETAILASKSEDDLHRYDTDQQMYQSCDIVIELIDCSFWEVFSKDPSLIARLREKFKKTEFLQPDFER